MTITAKNFATKAFVAVVAGAMVFSLVAPAAKADTVSDLQAQINALMAQIAALSGTPATTPAAGAYTFTRSLTIGSEGADVTALQNYLISKGFAIPAGATGYFGAQTQSAVAAWQTANGITPAAGYFGPVSQAKYAALMAATPVTPTTPTTPTDDTDTDADADLSGEASLSNFEVADGEDSDDVEEGSNDVAVGEFTVEFADGDAEISRIDLALEVDSGNDGDDDPWRVFDTISLWVDDEEVASIDASDADNYLDEDDGSLRFSDLGVVAMEDEEVVIVVKASVMSSIDGAANGEAWNIAAGAIRFFDADGVATTEDTVFDLQDISGVTLSTDIAEFSIEEAGAGDDLDLESSDEDPDASTIALDQDSNVEAAIFAFELSAEDSDGDVVVNDITITATTTVGSSTDDLVNDFRLEIDGESFDADSYVGTGSTVTLVFDMDGDFVIDADSVVTATLYADFEDMETNDEGATIIARVAAADVDVEGDASGEVITVDGSYVESDTHTLRTEGIDVTVTDDSAVASTIDGSDNDFGEFELEVDITAFGEDAYIANTGSAAFTYQIENSAGSVVATGTATSSTITADDADTVGSYYKIDDGSTETFTFRVTYDPLSSGEGVDYRVQFLTVIFNDTADTATPSTETLSPASDYETGFARISD